MRMLLVVLALAAGPTVIPALAAQPDCEPARCAVQAALAAECSCAAATNHGRYVSCVAHVVKRLAGTTIPTNCKGAVKRCAARSVCGKAGFVTCAIPTDTCDPTAHTCVRNPTIACLTDADCGTRCKIKRDATLCAASNGIVGTSPTCCAACAAP